MSDRVEGSLVIVDPNGSLAQMAREAGANLPVREPNTFMILDDDAQQCRIISENEFYASYVDRNIQSYQLQDGSGTSFDVDNQYVTLTYGSGAQVSILVGSIDYNPGRQAEQYALRRGIIYPIDEGGHVQFDATNTPGLVALRAWYAQEAKRVSDQLHAAEPADAPDITIDAPSAQSAGSGQASGASAAEPELSGAPKRPYQVESWRPLVSEMAGDIPVDVLLRWIHRESGGNPCSTGAKSHKGGSIENGLFQLYSPDDDHIASPEQLHGSFCEGQTCTRDLTLDEARLQVASGIALVRKFREHARHQLSQGGVQWDETGSDFWALVKMQHNLPRVPSHYIPKLHPKSWAEFKQGVLKEEPDIESRYGIFRNAEDIGGVA